MGDKFDEQAETLLKSFPRMLPPNRKEVEAVAAALREDGEIIERQRDCINAFLLERAEWVLTQAKNLALKTEIAQAQAEIARLGKQRDDLNYLVDLYRQNHEDAEALRTQLAEQRRCMESHNCAEKMGMFTLTPCLTCAWLAANREGKP